jgi:hypothetical protein
MQNYLPLIYILKSESKNTAGNVTTHECLEYN